MGRDSFIKMVISSCLWDIYVNGSRANVMKNVGRESLVIIRKKYHNIGVIVSH